MFALTNYLIILQQRLLFHVCISLYCKKNQKPHSRTAFDFWFLKRHLYFLTAAAASLASNSSAVFL